MKKNLAQFFVCLLLATSAMAAPVDDFFSAIKNDDTRGLINVLFRGFNPNTRDSNGLTGLHVAARLGSLKAAEVLLSQNKLEIEARTPQDENALMMAAIGGYEGLVKTLIAKGADVNKPGWTPLHYAATKGHLSIMKLLLDNHAYIDAESPNKSTPLMMAAMYGTPEGVKLLIEEGADVLLKNEQGLTALDFAKRANRVDAEGLLVQAIKDKRPKGSW